MLFPSSGCSEVEGTWTQENSWAPPYLFIEGLICWSRSLAKLNFWVQASRSAKPRISFCVGHAKMAPTGTPTSSSLEIMTSDSNIVLPMHQFLFCFIHVNSILLTTHETHTPPTPILLMKKWGTEKESCLRSSNSAEQKIKPSSSDSTMYSLSKQYADTQAS